MVQKRSIQRTPRELTKVVSESFKKTDDKLSNLIETLKPKSENDIHFYHVGLNLSTGSITWKDNTIAPSKSVQIEVTESELRNLEKQGKINNILHKEESNSILGIEYLTRSEISHITLEVKPTIQVPTIQPVEKGREPSKYQKAIFDYIKLLVNNDPRATQKHMVVEAVAGSGKTWTIEQATKLIPPSKSVCFLAFNTSIRDELKKRAPYYVKAMTLNGAGYSALREALKTHGKNISTVDSSNVMKILNTLFRDKYTNFTLQEIDNLKQPVIRLVSLYKATGMEVNNSSTESLMDEHGLASESDTSDITMLCSDVLNINRNILTNSWYGIDFDDQIWVTVTRNLPIVPYDYVFVDETQDLSYIQLELVMKMCKKGGSIIAVGDRNQSIYQFRGADSEAIPRIISTLNAKVFPLSITYRCPISHVKLAQQYVPEIEWATISNAGYNAIEGEVIYTTSDKVSDFAKEKDRIICRNNAPLVPVCFDLIRKGKQATIMGSDIGEGLIKLMETIKGDNLDDFMFRLTKWYESKKEKLEKKNKSIDKITDQYETLQVIAEDCEDIKCMVYKIQKIFSNKESAITLSTIHKAKGLEAETKENSIFVIKSHKGKSLMPSPYATTPKQIKQEHNLIYVAYTRGKNKMYIVG